MLAAMACRSWLANRCPCSRSWLASAGSAACPGRPLPGTGASRRQGGAGQAHGAQPLPDAVATRPSPVAAPVPPPCPPPPRRGRLAGMLLPGSGGDLSRPSGAWRGSPRRPRGSARSGTWRRCRRSECHAGTGGPSHSARSSRRGAGAGAGPTCPGPGGRPVGEEQVITAESVGGDVGMDLRGRGQRVPVRATPHSARHGRFGAVARRWWRARSRAVRSR